MPDGILFHDLSIQSGTAVSVYRVAQDSRLRRTGEIRGGERERLTFKSPLETDLKKAKLPKIKFYDLRHTFASNFVLRGGRILSLKEILGHADISTTMMYAHLAPSYLEEEINRLDFR